MLNLKLKQSAAVENQLQLQLLIAEALIEANKKFMLTPKIRTIYPD